MQSLQRLNSATNFLRRKIGSRTQLRQVEWLLTVMLAHPDRISMVDLTKMTDTVHSVCSRNVRIFGTYKEVDEETGKAETKGFGWVDFGPSQFGGREFDVWLTEEGQKLATELGIINDGGESYRSYKAQ